MIKKVCDEDKIAIPANQELYQDTGFQGYKPAEVRIHQPMKKPAGEELEPADKIHNRLISKIRVAIEHVIGGVKRCRIVKEVYRNTKDHYDDLVMELACALHNFRSNYRLACY